MRLEVGRGETVRPLNNELLDVEFAGREIRKKDLFADYNLDMKRRKKNFPWTRASTSWSKG